MLQALSQEKILPAIRRVEAAFRDNPDSRWLLGFSGGKDSSALLRIAAHAARRIKPKPLDFTVFYCDTGVESLVLDTYVKTLISDLTDEFASEDSVGFKVAVLKAPVKERFFVRIIGRGYMPPTSFFRWCTKSLRINPVKSFIQDQARQKQTFLMLGTRQSESAQRDRMISQFEDPFWQRPIESNGCDKIFAPIVDWQLSDVWDAIFVLDQPKSLNSREVFRLYEDAQGECPIIRELNDKPCASGRMGCWTCTVVRRDRSALQFIESGHNWLSPFLSFRDWLSKFRDDPSNRWPERRNGRASPGPFTLHARREIYERVRQLEKDTGVSLISEEEWAHIQIEWQSDIGRERLLLQTM